MNKMKRMRKGKDEEIVEDHISRAFISLESTLSPSKLVVFRKRYESKSNHQDPLYQSWKILRNSCECWKVMKVGELQQYNLTLIRFYGIVVNMFEIYYLTRTRKRWRRIIDLNYILYTLSLNGLTLNKCDFIYKSRQSFWFP